MKKLSLSKRGKIILIPALVIGALIAASLTLTGTFHSKNMSINNDAQDSHFYLKD